MFGQELPEGMDDVNLGELRRWLGLMSSLHSMSMEHAMLIIAEPDHECDTDEEFSEDLAKNGPEFEMSDIQAFFAYESSMLQMFDIVRKTLQAQGFAVNDKADHE